MQEIKDKSALIRYANYLLRTRQSYYTNLRKRTWQTGPWDFDPFRESDVLRDWRQELVLFSLQEEKWEMFPMRLGTAREEIFIRWNSFLEENGLATRYTPDEVPVDSVDKKSIKEALEAY